MSSCIFCSIVTKEIKTRIIYEDEYTVAFLDIQPRAPGHAVVIPKEHAETILGISDESLGLFFIAVKRVTELLHKTILPDGFTIGINHGKHAGQVVEHVHVHVIPRWQSDGGGSIHGVVKNTSMSLEEVYKKITHHV